MRPGLRSVSAYLTHYRLSPFLLNRHAKASNCDTGVALLLARQIAAACRFNNQTMPRSIDAAVDRAITAMQERCRDEHLMVIVCRINSAEVMYRCWRRSWARSGVDDRNYGLRAICAGFPVPLMSSAPGRFL